MTWAKAQRKGEVMSDPLSAVDWKRATTPQNTALWFRPEQVLCYGEVGIVAGAGLGNSWISFIGTETRWYVLNTVDELHEMVYNTQVGATHADSQPLATEVNARYRVGFNQPGQGQAIVSRS